MPTAAEVYRRTRKGQDLPWNQYVCRPLAAPLVAFLADTRVTPNQITLAAFLLASAASVGVALAPGHLGLGLAVLVFELAYVLDCADGMLARWRGTASPTGHLLDFLMDELKAFGLVAAAALRLWRESHEPLWLVLGLVALLGLASGIALTTFLRRPEVTEPPGATEPVAPRAPSPARRLIALIEAPARFVIHYPSYLWLVAIAGRLELYLVPYAAVNLLYAARAWLGVAVRFGRA